MNSKTSRLRRKYVNAMRSMSDVPWPARRFRYPAMSTAVATNYRCEQLYDMAWKRTGVLRFVRPAKPKWVVCGAPLVAVPFKHRLECPRCRVRTKQDLRLARMHKLSVLERAKQSEPWSVAKAARGRFFSRRKV